MKTVKFYIERAGIRTWVRNSEWFDSLDKAQLAVAKELSSHGKNPVTKDNLRIVKVTEEVVAQ